MTEAERVEQIYNNSSPDMLTPEGWQFLIKMARIGASVMPRPLSAAPPVSPATVERVAKAICRENCAFVGEKPCFEVEGAWPNPNCQEPGCHSQARAALAAINGEK